MLSTSIEEERPIWFSRFITKFKAEIVRRPNVHREHFANFFYLNVLSLLQKHSVCTLTIYSDTTNGTQYRHIFSIDRDAFYIDLALTAFEHGVGTIKPVE